MAAGSATTSTGVKLTADAGAAAPLAAGAVASGVVCAAAGPAAGPTTPAPITMIDTIAPKIRRRMRR